MCPLFHGKQQEQYLRFAHLKHCLRQQKETIWFPPFWSVYSPYKPSFKRQYPQRESYFLQWPSTSPFHQGATLTKAQCWRRSFLSLWYLTVTAGNTKCGNTLWENMFTKSILSPRAFSCLVTLGEQEQSYYSMLRRGLSTVRNLVSIKDINSMNLTVSCLMKHGSECRLKLGIRCVAYK